MVGLDGATGILGSIGPRVKGYEYSTRRGIVDAPYFKFLKSQPEKTGSASGRPAGSCPLLRSVARGAARHVFALVPPLVQTGGTAKLAAPWIRMRSK